MHDQKPESAAQDTSGRDAVGDIGSLSAGMYWADLRLHNLELPVGKIVTAFVENGLEVSEAATSEESLEDYFKRVTGGEGIA